MSSQSLLLSGLLFLLLLYWVWAKAGSGGEVSGHWDDTCSKNLFLNLLHHHGDNSNVFLSHS